MLVEKWTRWNIKLTSFENNLQQEPCLIMGLPRQQIHQKNECKSLFSALNSNILRNKQGQPWIFLGPRLTCRMGPFHSNCIKERYSLLPIVIGILRHSNLYLVILWFMMSLLLKKALYLAGIVHRFLLLFIRDHSKSHSTIVCHYQ